MKKDLSNTGKLSVNLASHFEKEKLIFLSFSI